MSERIGTWNLAELGRSIKQFKRDHAAIESNIRTLEADGAEQDVILREKVRLARHINDYVWNFQRMREDVELQLEGHPLQTIAYLVARRVRLYPLDRYWKKHRVVGQLKEGMRIGGNEWIWLPGPAVKPEFNHDCAEA
ncbi:hypothetical protein [Corynebacterium heidelbergense]|uniref:Uncharacterized protein n=1 Tax=Corynebacterium heidelbergense TaxID=2055947 RepID=A0A364VE25_9CORY|nr:hypothetical protein [Corynebacterium heidelbergense]RAV34912.1 hypothetical protein CWC39_00815 [Corynebacterium heidelbergense]WCZ36049.1 hypothetical protein CHEID_02415 [Corynebacterium heidelbergense]